jgi:GTP-binding protein
LVDVAPYQDSGDPIRAAQVVLEELEKFGADLSQRERWLVLTKLDLVSENERDDRIREIRDGLSWKGPLFSISAINGQGTEKLMYKIMEHIEDQRRRALDAAPAPVPGDIDTD